MAGIENESSVPWDAAVAVADVAVVGSVLVGLVKVVAQFCYQFAASVLLQGEWHPN